MSFSRFLLLGLSSFRPSEGRKKALEGIEAVSDMEPYGSHGNFLLQPIFALAPWQKLCMIFLHTFVPLLMCVGMCECTASFPWWLEAHAALTPLQDWLWPRTPRRHPGWADGAPRESFITRGKQVCYTKGRILQMETAEDKIKITRVSATLDNFLACIFLYFYKRCAYACYKIRFFYYLMNFIPFIGELQSSQPNFTACPSQNFSVSPKLTTCLLWKP